MTDTDDTGAPRERTLLAWHRTSLAIVIGSVALARYGAEVVGPQVALAAAPGLVLAVVASVLALVAYRVPHGGRASRRPIGGDGRRFVVLAAAVVSVGAACVLLVVSRIL
ncbi:DUF202 domain-containing protein [Demequina zhanjiangensis]|uniref:DUF202 domain-containing protein n=1 Tax=Demequina zhanjiangensis TaxID=3051659 RepID=A0ABT8G0Q9_9MICO|nr:DUF202 domain-containing protein [Demequina sp. SYSU T00b26]MDN4472597.1 DUF202 domain-containing protein [Demequina sp. SYSU T00b26]